MIGLKASHTVPLLLCRTFRQKSESLAGALFLARLAILLNTFNGHVNSHDSLRQTGVTVSDGQTNFQI